MICFDMTGAAPDLSLSLPAAEVLAQVRRQLAALDELTGIGLEAARALVQPASGQDVQPAAPGIVALAYARVSHAVRLTVMLQQKMIKDISAGLAETERALARAPDGAEEDDAPPTPEEVRKTRAARIVARQTQDWEPGEMETVETLFDEAVERLDDEDLYGDLMDRPLSEIVARLCKDIGLEPDWSQLSQELWAQREMASGAVGAPLAAAIAAAMAGGGPRADPGGKPGEERVVEGESRWFDASASPASDSS
jgi:hypothetical protein